MTKYALTSVWMVGFLVVFTTSCIPPGKSETVKLVTQEEFDQFLLPIKYDHDGGLRISHGIQLGSLNIEFILRQAAFNRSSGYLSISGYVVDRDTKEAMPYVNVVIGTVEYHNGLPLRILPKKRVVSGDKGAFFIESKIETGDLLFFAPYEGYIMETIDISQLLQPQ